jgi:myo-inositol-1(or 4)-monophosphatase
LEKNAVDNDAVMELARELALEIGSRMKDVLSSSESFSIQQKGKNDLVTEIDLWAERLIIEKVAHSFPTHLVLGEEYSAGELDRLGQSFSDACRQGVVWVVDPLDGTANFASRIPHNVVSIAVLKDGTRQLGVVYDPYRQEIFRASAGAGAWLNDEKIMVRRRTRVSDAVVATGFPAGISGSWSKYLPAHEAFLMNCHKLRVLGAAALELCWVACGRLDGFFQYGLKPWDVAAGSLIVEEAGGIVGPFDCDEAQGFSLFDKTLLASNPELFPQMRKLATPLHEPLSN